MNSETVIGVGNGYATFNRLTGELGPVKGSYREAARWRGDDLDGFTRAYLECALWADAPEGTAWSVDDVDAGTVKEAQADCGKFQKDHAFLLSRSYERNGGHDEHSAGHDFWLTRSGHGTGYWDRGLGALGELLTEAAQVYRALDVVVGDDGMIYFG